MPRARQRDAGVQFSCRLCAEFRLQHTQRLLGACIGRMSQRQQVERRLARNRVEFGQRVDAGSLRSSFQQRDGFARPLTPEQRGSLELARLQTDRAGRESVLDPCSPAIHLLVVAPLHGGPHQSHQALACPFRRVVRIGQRPELLLGLLPLAETDEALATEIHGGRLQLQLRFPSR